MLIKNTLLLKWALNPCFIRVALEKNDNRVIGFMMKEGNLIEQLYVHVDYQSEGLGSLFINQAKEEEEEEEEEED